MTKRALNFNGIWTKDAVHSKTANENISIFVAYVVLVLCLTAWLMYYHVATRQMKQRLVTRNNQLSTEAYQSLLAELEQKEALLAKLSVIDQQMPNALFTYDELSAIGRMENESTKLLAMEKSAEHWMVTIRTQTGEDMMANTQPEIFMSFDLIQMEDHFQYVDMTYQMVFDR